MKKEGLRKSRKLLLSRETLTILASPALEPVAGGAITDAQTLCLGSCRNCHTGGTCTTIYC